MTAPADGFTHSALLYASTEDYLAATVAFVRGGLARQEPVLVAAPHPNLTLLKEALTADADRVALLDMTGIGRNPGRIIPSVLYAFADSHPTGPVRIVSESVWPGRTPEEIVACVQHEALVNLAFAGRRVTIMCPFAHQHLGRPALTDVHATHPVLIDGSGWRRSGRFAPAEVLDAGNARLSEPPTAFTLSFDLSTFTRARHEAVAFARRVGLPDRQVYAVGVAVSELASNSIRHGGGSGTLRIWTEDGHLVCEVHDRGRLDDPLAGRRPVPASQLTGRGLLLVNLVTDLVRTRFGAGGTTVRFSMAIARPVDDGLAGGGR